MNIIKLLIKSILHLFFVIIFFSTLNAKNLDKFNHGSQISNYLDIKKEAMDILSSIKPPELLYHEVSKDVNNPINNDPKLIKAL